MKQRRGLLTEPSPPQARPSRRRCDPGLRQSLTEEHGPVEDSLTVAPRSSLHESAGWTGRGFERPGRSATRGQSSDAPLGISLWCLRHPDVPSGVWASLWGEDEGECVGRRMIGASRNDFRTTRLLRAEPLRSRGRSRRRQLRACGSRRRTGRASVLRAWLGSGFPVIR